MKWTHAVISVVLFSALLSLISLNRFPPVNFDEVGNAAMAAEYNRSGRVAYTLMEGVIDPAFEDFSAAGQEGLRGTYTMILGGVMRIIGPEFVRLRFLSFFGWIVLGFLLAFFVRRLHGSLAALLSVLLIFLSPATILSAHLIRPDIFLVIIVVMMCWLTFFSGPLSAPGRGAAAGFLAGFSVGLHPHGLLLVPLAALPFFRSAADRPTVKTGALGLGLGLLASLVLFLFTVDIETYALGRHSYVMQLYQQNSTVWRERLWPWNLLADSFLLVAGPGSFYLPESFQHPNLWPLAGAASFILLAFSGCWLVFEEKKIEADRFILAAAALLFFGVGFGHVRREVIYTLPLTAVSAVLAAAVLIRSLRRIRRNVEIAEAARGGLFIAGVLLLLIFMIGSAFWLFRASILFLTLLLIMSLVVDKRRNAAVVKIGVLGLVLLLSLWIRAKDVMRMWDHQTWARLSSSEMFVPLGIFGLSAAAFYAVLRRSQQRELIHRTAGSLMKVGILLTALLFIGASGFVHRVNSLSGAPLARTFERVDALTRGVQGPVLGPHFFWFRYQDSFRDIEALVLDYLYSGQKRAAAAIERARPEIVIVDEGIRRRFQIGHDPGKKRYFVIPFDQVAGVQSVYLGSVPESAHHSRLDVYRLLWPDH